MVSLFFSLIVYKTAFLCHHLANLFNQLYFIQTSPDQISGGINNLDQPL